MTLDLKGQVRPADQEFDFDAKRSLLGRVLLAIAKMRANAMLKRTLRPYRSGTSPPIPPYLRRDLGLPPDYERRSHWDHQ